MKKEINKALHLIVSAAMLVQPVGAPAMVATVVTPDLIQPDDKAIEEIVKGKVDDKPVEIKDELEVLSENLDEMRDEVGGETGETGAGEDENSENSGEDPTLPIIGGEANNPLNEANNETLHFGENVETPFLASPAAPMALESVEYSDQLVINEFSPNSTPEWVEIYNKGSESINLENWKLHFDDNTSIQTHTFSASDSISGKGYFKINTGGSYLANTGDTIIIKNPAGNTVDEVKYGNVSGAEVVAPNNANKSASRCPNGTGSWIITNNQTPEAANDCGNEKVTICHATDSQSNPYVVNEPDESGDVSGHDGHEGPVWYPGIADHSWGDIIPPFDYEGGSYAGKNWTAEGQAIWDNGCQIPEPETVCGDGEVEGDEQCDDGSNNGAYGYCNNYCSDIGENCGDDIINGSETCDGGSQICTDPFGYAGSEDCLETCDGWGECQPSQYCGDGYVNGNEMCDDGNTNSDDGCSATCENETLPICGNDVLESGEQCDDGNLVSGDGCDKFCHTESICPVCGDGVKEGDEQCDDGNVIDGDGCSATCQTEEPEPYCGDGKKDENEKCDDGNTASGDGCSDKCEIEQAGWISGKKFEDCNMDGILNGRCESGILGWTIFLDKNGNSLLDEGETSRQTDHLGNYTFIDLYPGAYRVCEVQREGWLQTLPANGECYEVELNGEKLAGYYFGNFEYGYVEGKKFNDLDGDGVKDYGEEYLNDWAIRLYDSQWQYVASTLTAGEDWEQGEYAFDNLEIGTYYVCEAMKSGWVQTKPAGGYSVTDNLSGAADEGAKCYRLEVEYSGDYFCDKVFGNRQVAEPYCGNGILDGEEQCDDGNTNNGDGCSATCQTEEENAPRSILSKSNNKYPVDQLPGAEVEYTLTYRILDADVSQNYVTDLPPEGFKYRSGSWKVYLNGVQQFGIAEPQYHSPAVWDLTSLGTLHPEDEVRLVYLADISLEQDPGLYKDLAWAEGISDSNSRVLANDAESTPFFVGTAVSVIKSEAAGLKVALEKDNDERSDTKTKRVERVLGASKGLPETGIPSFWILSALAGLIVGINLLVAGKKKKNLPLAAALICFSFGFLGMANDVRAAGELSVQIEQPKSPVNTNNFKVGFVALDIEGRSVAVKCWKKGPGEAGFTEIGADYAAKAGGNSGDCLVTPAVAPVDGDYQFKISATANGTTIETEAVAVKVVASRPGTPLNYDRQGISKCEKIIHFRTANDGGKTVKVELYRATKLEFTADASTKVGEVAIGSDQDGSITNMIPGNCSQDHYYAIRAVDAAGNGSNFTGDKKINVDYDIDTKVKYVDVAGAIQGAIAAGAGTTDEEAARQEEEEVGQVEGLEEGKDGQVLGEKTEEELAAEEAAKKEDQFWKSAGTLLGLGAIGYIFYAIAKRRKSNQPTLPDMDEK